jgi:hypothetical protein
VAGGGVLLEADQSGAFERGRDGLGAQWRERDDYFERAARVEGGGEIRIDDYMHCIY